MKALLLAALAAAAQTPSSGYWTRRHPVRNYGAIWHLELAAKDFAKAKGRVEAVLSKHKGVSTVPAGSEAGSDKVRFRQWSYAFSRQDAAKAFKRLEKLGTVRRSSRTENPVGEDESEARTKLERLRVERDEAAPLLERLPATAAAAAEVQAHLEEAVSSWDRSKDRVLLNLSLEEAR